MAELEKAAAGAAHRKLNAGLPARDPVADGLRLANKPILSSRLLFIVMIASALCLVGLALSYVVTIPPAHLDAIGLLILWIFWPRRKKT